MEEVSFGGGDLRRCESGMKRKRKREWFDSCMYSMGVYWFVYDPPASKGSKGPSSVGRNFYCQAPIDNLVFNGGHTQSFAIRDAFCRFVCSPRS